MRPAYRYSVAVVILVLSFGAAAAAIGWPSSSPPIADDAPARPAPARRVAPPAPATEVPRALDRLEEDEAASLGPAQAAARRRQREQLIRERGGTLPEPAPAPQAPVP